ncbi:MAG: DUF1460 domain-containing protein [Gammaproteobacteria bacterium]|nr:DUF1460 domain-containing protein [Gammaproteobacteria bacterium]
MKNINTCLDNSKQILNLAERIDYFSSQFLGLPYLGGAQGEGLSGEFDQSPLYRFDAFDCLTYVNNVLALSLSQNEAEFVEKLLQINYYDGIAKYENRFHFMSVDWNPQNQKNKILVDVTSTIGEVKFAEGEIDRPNWFLHRSEKDIKLLNASSENEINKRVEVLRNISNTVKKEFAHIPYLPLTLFFDPNKNPVEMIFNKIPNGSIIEIVRPNWNLREKIGTNLHVSHLGFAIRRDNQLYFRHASSEKKSVVAVLLVDYLRDCLDSETIKGIAIFQIPRA